MKRLLKKLLPAVLGMTMLFSITAYAQINEDARNAYEQMQAKSASTSEGNTYCHFVLQMQADGETMDMAVDMNMLYKNLTQPDQLQMLVQYIFSADGQQMPMTMWVRDGYAYMEAGGMKQKTRMDMTDALNMAADPSYLSGSIDTFTDLSLKVEGDKYRLSYKMDGAKLNAFIQELLNSMGMGDLFTSTGITMTMHDVTGDYVLNQDFTYDTATLSMGLDLSAEGETLSLRLNGHMEDLNPGQPVEILYPDFSEYVDTAALDAA